MEINQERKYVDIEAERVSSKTLKELQGLIDVLFGLELIVVDELYLSVLVKNIGLPSGQCTEKIGWHSPFFSNFVALVT